ncbi:fibronectin type III domain-containing protein [Sporosarcina sp. resist]|uniref:fibronectin type III domain-containing protein n=1 Tax=Sporosarcina sp. resist TaxID=2762563 RepID=UPI00164DDEC5|nr:fibronectin type III domain-containing protein [Sporosarcina sp. resist]QNK87736.1 fibronectin type III domain-containing protein [Sporosarcina sp. resist]
MALYNYSKYSIAYYFWGEPPKKHNDPNSGSAQSGQGMPTQYSWDSASKLFSASGSLDWTTTAPGTRWIRLENGGQSVTVFTATSYPSYPDQNITYDWYTQNASDAVGVPSRGNLITTLIAEDGRYPANGALSDGFWYVRGAAVNTAPTTPGTFTQPTGTLEIGDSKTISWGASSDAESNLSKYILEVSVNNGAWTKIGQPTTPSFTYTVPMATSIKFRVKAVDAAGLESAYRDSTLLTVQKPMYYWNKHQVNVTNSYYEPGWVFQGTAVHGWFNCFTAYNFNSATGKYTLAGTTYRDKSISIGSVGYSMVGDTLHQLTATKSSSGNDVESTSYTKTGATLNQSLSAGALIQSGIVAVEGTYPNSGRHTDGYWYMRGSRLNASIAPPAAFTTPGLNETLTPRQAIDLTFGASTAPNISNYEVEYRYNEDAWTPVGTHSNALIRPFTVTENKTLTKVEFRVRAKNTSNVYSDYVYSESFSIEHNRVPTVTLNTENNVTLYENDTFKIDGSGLDLDIGDIVNVYYRINGGTSRAIATGISKGASIPFNEQLKFKGGVLYEGETAVTDALAEGPAHRLEVWSEDNQSGKSTIAERTFYVVPNRAPALTVDPFIDQSGMIDNDTIKLSGVSSDPDGNDVTVKYRVNEQAAVQIHSGAAGAWSFDLSFKLLRDGENTIVVEVTDTHNFKSSKTIKLNKTANLTPLEKSVQRYEIVPPAGTAQGVFLWVRRDKDQEVLAEISMTTGTEQEQYVPLTLDASGPSGDGMEDFFKLKVDAPAENIILKLSWTDDKPIIMISGALLQ